MAPPLHRDASVRRPRDFNSELKALSEKADLLHARKLHQLGELVVATGADALPIEQLAGALSAAAEATDATKEAWGRRGARMFQKKRRSPGGGAGSGASGAPESAGGTLPLDGGASSR